MSVLKMNRQETRGREAWGLRFLTLDGGDKGDKQLVLGFPRQFLCWLPEERSPRLSSGICGLLMQADILASQSRRTLRRGSAMTHTGLWQTHYFPLLTSQHDRLIFPR